MRRRAFTLIEVLVVVAIIALLVSILLPSIAAAKRRGRAAICLSNMRQLGIASHMYAGAWKGALLDYGLAHGGSVDESTTWFNTLKRHYQNKLVARCPEDRSPYWMQEYPTTTQKRRVSYGINEYLTGRIEQYERYHRMDAIRRTATTILFCEMTQTGDYAVSDHVHAVDWQLSPLESAKRQIEVSLHVERSNYVFVDSHAEPCTFDQTYKIKSRRKQGPKIVIDWGHNMYDPTIAY